MKHTMYHILLDGIDQLYGVVRKATLLAPNEEKAAFSCMQVSH
jgi:hypothetical protein